MTQNELFVRFSELGFPIPDSVFKLSIEIQTEIYQYFIQMSCLQKKAYLIAMNHLKSSFDIYKSNGFIEWKKSKK
jgi:hypothetical protein